MARKLYEGPGIGAGHRFEIGGFVRKARRQTDSVAWRVGRDNSRRQDRGRPAAVLQYIPMHNQLNRRCLRVRYPFPYVAHYSGSGDQEDAASYRPVKSSVKVPQVFDSQARKLIGPNNQKFYRVENGRLVAGKSR